jgi:hypothetical protein
VFNPLPLWRVCGTSIWKQERAFVDWSSAWGMIAEILEQREQCKRRSRLRVGVFVLDEVCTAELEGSATHGYGSKSPEVHRARREFC